MRNFRHSLLRLVGNYTKRFRHPEHLPNLIFLRALSIVRPLQIQRLRKTVSNGRALRMSENFVTSSSANFLELQMLG